MNKLSKSVGVDKIAISEHGIMLFQFSLKKTLLWLIGHLQRLTQIAVHSLSIVFEVVMTTKRTSLFLDN
jgi:hypothetical protein